MADKLPSPPLWQNTKDLTAATIPPGATLSVPASGAGGGSGTVTSVGLTMPAEFSVADTPVTTSGTLAVTKADETANTVWAGPTTGAAAQPTFRSLVAADMPAGTVSPLTTKGDVYTYSSADARLPVGTDNYVLTPDSAQTTGLKWQSLSAQIDAVFGSTRGMLLRRGSSAWEALSLGSSGKVLTSDGTDAGWSLPQFYSSGTSNPGSPGTGDIFYRTDLNLLIFYDGAQWLTVQEYAFDTGGATTASFPFAATGYAYSMAVRSDYAVYMTRFVVTTFVAATNDVTKYWTVDLIRCTAANAETVMRTFNTSADTASNWTAHDIAVNAALDATARAVRVKATKTSTAGNIYVMCQLYCRLVVT